MNKLLFTLLLLPCLILADAPSEDLQANDYVVVSEGSTSLELKLVPQSIIKDTNLRTGALTATKKGDETLAARVGDLAFIIGEVKVDEKVMADTQFELTFHHIEDGKDVFKTTLNSQNGTLNWGQQLFDGAMHKVTLKAKSLNGAFKPIMAELNVDVEGIDPPSGVVIKSMAFLLAVIIIGMVIGYLISFKAITKKALT